MVELGVPFSDPLADGATIERASDEALHAGTTLAGCLNIAREIRSATRDTPLMLMGYYNPLLAFGVDRFVESAAAAGVDGLIVVDLPPEEGEELDDACRSVGLDNILLLAPNSEEERIRRVAQRASGFIYCVSVTGVTGAREELPPGLRAFLARVRRHADLPLAVGFGISRPEHVRSLRGLADAAVVGSAIINLIEESPPDAVESRLQEYARALSQAAR